MEGLSGNGNAKPSMEAGSSLGAHGWNQTIPPLITTTTAASADQHYAKESNEQARVHFEKAIALDAHYARAHSGLAFTHNLDYNFGWSEDVEASLSRAREASLQAIALDDSDNRARTTLGWTYVYQGRIDEGVAEIGKAVSLNPNDAGVLARGGYALTYQGEFEKAIGQVEKAMRLNPFHADYYYDALGWAQYFLEQYDDALRTMARIAKPNAGHNRSLAAIYARLGQMDNNWVYLRN